MKIGIYGGSFNPIHIGHEKIARFVIKELKLDLLLIIPVGIPSHRENNLKNANLRLELCKTVFENDEKIVVSDIEIKKNKVSYTYNTLINIIEMYGKDNEFYEIIGEDSLRYFKTWKNYEKILSLSKLVVLRRKNYKTFDKNLNIENDNIIYLENLYYDYSSTEIRKKIINKENIESLVNPKIINMLIEKSN